MKKRDYIIVWPAYLEAENSRKKGRRIPLKLAIEKVRLDEISASAIELGYKVEILNEKAYPRTWWQKGCVKIYPKKESKTALLRKLALKIREIRQRRKK